MSDNYRLLLKGVAELYERYEAGRRAPFNVFSVLRSASDEVNLHSRFLHALLNYRKPGEEVRENLKDFLEHVGIKDLEERGATVERERDHIDILITNVDKAIVIENKISAVDQPEQLQGYHETLENRGYGEIHLLYLTLDGHDPSEGSVGDLPCEAISYKDHLPPWLKRCQKRAYDEPELRESVAQYLQLVQKLTGTDLKGKYMNELRDLFLQGNNLVLAHDLHKGMVKAKALLLKKLWDEIEDALAKLDLPDKDDTIPGPSPERIERFVAATGNDRRHGLYYGGGIKEAWLGIEVEDGRIFFGVRCPRNNGDERNNLDQILEAVPGGCSSEWWPWWRWDRGELNLKNPITRENLELLSNEKDRQKYAQNIAEDLGRVWKAIKGSWG